METVPQRPNVSNGALGRGGVTELARLLVESCANGVVDAGADGHRRTYGMERAT